VFGIGLPRTGTTSLVRALNLLGIKSVHNPASLLTSLDDPVLTDYEGFADNPLPLIYPELDRRFPNSRFILTDRDVDGWLRSVEWMITVGRKHGNWDANPRTIAMHTALYGSIDFRPAAFRERFLRHRKEVQAYFAHRSTRLLVIDLTRGDGWEPLCAFLGVPVPRTKFPHDNRSDALFLRERMLRLVRRMRAALRGAAKS
jgi:hypothetical protein